MFKGAAKPLVGNSINSGHFHGLDGLGDAPDPNAPSVDLVQEESAVMAMIRIVNENPGEVRGHNIRYTAKGCATHYEVQGTITFS